MITTVAGGGTQTSPTYSGPATAAALDAPVAVAVDGSGDLFIADQDNNVVREVDLKDGTISTVAGTGDYGYNGDNQLATDAMLEAPDAVAVDGSGDLFIADRNNARIRQVVLSTGIITTVAGGGTQTSPTFSGPAADAELNGPQGLAVDGSGHLFIADGYNAVVREVNLTAGTISTVAGTGTVGYGGDGGPATDAEFNGPTGLAVDGSGDLFIADANNNRVREVFASTGMIATIAGNGRLRRRRRGRPGHRLTRSYPAASRWTVPATCSSAMPAIGSSRSTWPPT